jgi:hypothetical protein
MSPDRPTDPLSLDVAADLERVDSVVTQILQDRTVWDEFLRDPNGVFIRLGLHAPTSPTINARTNRAFYATLTNKPLLKLVHDHYHEFRATDAEKEQVVEGLRRGVIQHPIDLDFRVLDHLTSHPQVLRRAIGLTLHNLNNKDILERRYPEDELDDYVDRVADAIEARRPRADRPQLESWDRLYGIGTSFVGAVVEAGVLVTAVAVVEVEAAGTAFAFVVAKMEVAVQGPDGPILTAWLDEATQGDKESIAAVTILGRLLDLSGEMLAYANDFEALTE